MTGNLPKTSVRWIALTLLGLCVLCFLGYWYYSPYLAVRSLVQSLESGDTAAISRFIDYPVLRFHIQKQINNQIELELEERKQPGSSSPSIDAYSFDLVDKLVSRLVSEQGISSLLKGERSFTPAGTLSEFAEKEGAKGDQPGFSYHSGYGTNMNQFELLLTPLDRPQKEVSVQLSREGFFYWKVTNVLLPVDP